MRALLDAPALLARLPGPEQLTCDSNQVPVAILPGVDGNNYPA